MSVAKIIEQIKALSPEDRIELLGLIRELQSEAAPATVQTIRYAKDEQARLAGDQVVAEHAEVFRRLAE